MIFSFIMKCIFFEAQFLVRKLCLKEAELSFFFGKTTIAKLFCFFFTKYHLDQFLLYRKLHVPNISKKTLLVLFFLAFSKIIKYFAGPTSCIGIACYNNGSCDGSSSAPRCFMSVGIFQVRRPGSLVWSETATIVHNVTGTDEFCLSLNSDDGYIDLSEVR